jgi:DNA-binding transcriptional MerR regulator
MTKDHRKQFIGISRMLADGLSLGQVRQALDAADPEESSDPRTRFIRDSQRLARGESLAAVARKSAKGSERRIRTDAHRIDYGASLKLADQEDEAEKDLRAALLKRLAALSAA